MAEATGETSESSKELKGEVGEDGGGVGGEEVSGVRGNGVRSDHTRSEPPPPPDSLTGLEVPIPADVLKEVGIVPKVHKLDEEGLRIPDLKVKIVRHVKQWEEVSALEFDKPYTEYVVRVKDEDIRLLYYISKRYREFAEFNEQVTKLLNDAGEEKGKLPPFPPKKTFGNMDEQFVKERYAGLCIWFNAVSKMELITNSKIFLQFVNYRFEFEKYEMKVLGKRRPTSKSQVNPNKLTLELRKWRETDGRDGEDIHVEYQIKVYVDGTYWMVERRYSEFDELYHALLNTLPKDQHSHVPKLPPKKFFGSMDEAFLNQRRDDLNEWLKKLVDIPQIISASPFLHFCDNLGIMFKWNKGGKIFDDESDDDFQLPDENSTNTNTNTFSDATTRTNTKSLSSLSPRSNANTTTTPLNRVATSPIVYASTSSTSSPNATSSTSPPTSPRRTGGLIKLPTSPRSPRVVRLKVDEDVCEVNQPAQGQSRGTSVPPPPDQEAPLPPPPSS